jgi:hypothetical protein
MLKKNYKKIYIFQTQDRLERGTGKVRSSYLQEGRSSQPFIQTYFYNLIRLRWKFEYFYCINVCTNSMYSWVKKKKKLNKGCLIPISRGAFESLSEFEG